MQNTAVNNLVLTDLSSNRWLAELPKHISHAGFYQQAAAIRVAQSIWTREKFNNLGRKIVAQAEYAYAIRRLDIVEQLIEKLLSLPLDIEFRYIAQHFQALCLYLRGQWAQSYSLSEQVVENAPMKFRARALMNMSNIHVYGEGNRPAALPIYVEAGRVAANCRDPFTAMQAQRSIAILKSVNGDHRAALEDLENMFPMVRAFRSLYPSAYYEHLNSLAVEMMEVGRFEEARNATQIALASPFASVHPEWQETYEEIKIKQYRAPRPVSIPYQKTSKSDNLLRLPERADCSIKVAPAPLRKEPTARILDYLEWKKKMIKESDGNQTVANEEMNERDMFLQIIELSSQQDITEKKLRRILTAIKEIVTEPDEG